MRKKVRMSGFRKNTEQSLIICRINRRKKALFINNQEVAGENRDEKMYSNDLFMGLRIRSLGRDGGGY